MQESFTNQNDDFMSIKPAMTVHYLEENHGNENFKKKNFVQNTKNYLVKKYKPSKACFGYFFKKRFPFFNWIRSYDVKNDLTKDFFSGITLGIVNVPQAIAYSFMIGVPAATGLYVSFFTTVLYIIFGTSRHISVGTDAIISLVIAAAITDNENTINFMDFGTNVSMPINQTGLDLQNNLSSSNSFLSYNQEQGRIRIGMALSLLAGLFHILFSLINVGILSRYLSDAIVNGFVSAAAFHIALSQVRNLLGIKKTNDITIPFAVIGNIIEMSTNFINTNLITVVISIISIIFIYLVKVHINERFKDKLVLPVPVELIVLIVGTVASYFANFNQNYNVKIVGPIPLGFPQPFVPPTSIYLTLLGDAFEIAVISFCINLSYAKQYARKNKYEIDPNQELIAHGLSNIVCSFFTGYPGCVALARCAVFDQSGGRTQIHGIFSAIIVLLVILVLGPLLRCLPNACLAAIIVVALRTRLIEFTNLPKLYRKNKIEAVAWFATYISVIILDVDYGLYIGLVFSLLVVILRTQRPTATVMGNIPETTIYECIDSFKNVREFESIKIIRYEESIYYANVDNFKYQIIKLSEIDPTHINNLILKEFQSKSGKNFFRKHFKLDQKKINENKTIKKFFNNSIVSDKNQPQVAILGEENNELDKNSFESIKQKIILKLRLKYIIIDCSCVNYIDSQGIDAILYLNEIYKSIGITLYLSSCKRELIKSFKKFSVQEKLGLNHMFLTINEAVCHIIQTSKTKIKFKSVLEEITELNSEDFIETTKC